MPLVPAKCPICGAILNIGSKKEAAVCQNCGNAFVVEKAINNYNTYNSIVNNITADTVVVQNESEKEQLNKNGETYIKLGSWKKARETYQQLVEKFPDDYRGWWRLINCYYGDIKTEADFLLHMQRMEALQKLVSENDFLRYQAIMDEKLHAAAQVNAELDTEKRLAEAKKLCSEYESKIPAAESAIQSCLACIDTANRECENRLSLIKQAQKIDGFEHDTLNPINRYNRSIDAIRHTKDTLRKIARNKVITYGLGVLVFIAGDLWLKCVVSLFIIMGFLLLEVIDSNDNSIFVAVANKKNCLKNHLLTQKNAEKEVIRINETVIGNQKGIIKRSKEQIENAARKLEKNKKILSFGEDEICLFYLSRWHNLFRLENTNYNPELDNMLS